MVNLISFQKDDPDNIVNLEVADAIKAHGYKGEALRVKIGGVTAYLVADQVFEKWAVRSTGEPRVCFTPREIKSFRRGLGPNPPQPETHNDVIRPIVKFKQVFPRSRVVSVIQAEPEAPF